MTGDMNDIAKYYIVKFIIESEEEYYTIWVSDEYDEFLGVNNRLLSWSSVGELTSFAEEKGIVLENGVSCYDLNMLKDNIRCREDCGAVLDFWNIFSDLAKTSGRSFMGDDLKYNDIYIKLLAGCNLPAFNQTEYTAVWETEECLKIKMILNDGMDILFQSLGKRIQRS